MKNRCLSVLILFLSVGISSCATTGPKVTRAEIEQAKEEFNAKFFEASQIWLPRVYRVGYRILKAPVPELVESAPEFNFIGVGVTELKDHARKVYGIDKSVKGGLVLGLYPASQAERLDILPGDVIVALDGKKTSGLGAYFRRLKDAEGKAAKLKIWRRAKILEREVPIEKVYYKAQFFLEPTPNLEASASWSRINVGIGALRYSRNDDELAFIMSHELAHVTRKHKIKEFGAQLGTAVAYGAMAGVIEAFTFPGLGRAVMEPAQAATNAAVSREYEREADYFGMKHAFHAGYDVAHGAVVFSRLSTDAPGFQVLAFTFASHPATPERYLRLKKAVEELQTQYPIKFPITPSQDWELNVPIRAGETVEEAVGRLLESRAPSSAPVQPVSAAQGPVLGTGDQAASVSIPMNTGMFLDRPASAKTLSAPSSVAVSRAFGTAEAASQAPLLQSVTTLAVVTPVPATAAQIVSDPLVVQGIELTKEPVLQGEAIRAADTEERLRVLMIKLAETEEQMEAMRREHEAAKEDHQRDAAEQMNEMMQKFGIESMGLSRDVDNWLVGSRIEDAGTRFSLSDGKVVWFCKFKSGFRSVVAAVNKPELTASWFAPDGSLYQKETFTIAFGNAQLARNELKFDTAHPEHHLGSWRVWVHHQGELIDDRRFDVVR